MKRKILMALAALLMVGGASACIPDEEAKAYCQSQIPSWWFVEGFTYSRHQTHVQDGHGDILYCDYANVVNGVSHERCMKVRWSDKAKWYWDFTCVPEI